MCKQNTQSDFMENICSFYFSMRPSAQRWQETSIAVKILTYAFFFYQLHLVLQILIQIIHFNSSNIAECVCKYLLCANAKWRDMCRVARQSNHSRGTGSRYSPFSCLTLRICARCVCDVFQATCITSKLLDPAVSAAQCAQNRETSPKATPCHCDLLCQVSRRYVFAFAHDGAALAATNTAPSYVAAMLWLQEQ